MALWKESLLARFSLRPKPQLTSTASASTIEFLSWELALCRAHHVRCRDSALLHPLSSHDPGLSSSGYSDIRGTSSPSSSPGRLLDVLAFSESGQRGPGTQDLRLVPVHACPPYLTLSHCWGSSPLSASATTTIATLRARQQRIPFATLPKTFRDAAQVVRRLGFRYLWIDALCIVQDSAADWAAEAAKMGDIYAGAVATVAAVASGNSEGGLFNRRSRTLLELDPVAF